MRQGSSGAWLKLGAAGIDLVLVNVAFVLSYLMRYQWELGREIAEYNYIPLDDYLLIQTWLSLMLLGSYALAGLYRRPRENRILDELATLLGATSIGILLTLAVVYIYQGYGYSRLMFIYTWMLTVGLLTAARAITHLVKEYLYHRGLCVQRVLVVGGGQLGLMAMHVVATEPGRGYRLIGFVSEDGDSDMGRFRCLGRLEDLEHVIAEHKIDGVIVALRSAVHRRILEPIQRCQRAGVEFKIVPDFYEISLSPVDVDELRGMPLLGLKAVSIQGANKLAKRMVDLALSLLVLACLLPLWAVVAALIRLDSPGPVFFRQVRVGRGGQRFCAYKFRSMRLGAERESKSLQCMNEATGPLFKMKRDPRVTRVGRWLRRSSFDESPQLLNVVRGEMSLVGPRPPLPREVEQYSEWHRKRLEVAPGLTGLWQVSGRSELPFDEMVLLDVYYIENWSLSLDFKIMLRTVPAVLSGRGAY